MTKACIICSKTEKKTYPYETKLKLRKWNITFLYIWYFFLQMQISKDMQMQTMHLTWNSLVNWILIMPGFVCVAHKRAHMNIPLSLTLTLVCTHIQNKYTHRHTHTYPNLWSKINRSHKKIYKTFKSTCRWRTGYFWKIVIIEIIFALKAIIHSDWLPTKGMKNWECFG